ncbi:extracellular GDSL-like lipase/acylhydrolase [Hymenopellis radicata]|nr:extracellular GDSL-like lipase/acylhydrolase [Hymenopellis radicata]
MAPPLIILVVSLFIHHAAAHLVARANHTEGHWIAAWASMPQLTEPANLPPAPFNTSSGVFTNATLRQTIHVTAPSSHIRLRFSNAFGTTDLPITAVTIARPLNGSAGSSSIDTGSLKNVSFSGSTSFTIPNGALVVSDPVDLDVEAQSELTVSMYLARGQAGNAITSHPGSRTTTWMTFGDLTRAQNVSGGSTASVAHWYFLSALEAWVPPAHSTFAIIGDSITDGRGSDDNKNNRWPDQLLALLQSSSNTSIIAIANQAAGGNRVLADILGPNALGRFDRDVLAQSGVKYAMIFEGVNDIGVAASTDAAQQAIGDALIAAFKQLSIRSRAAGIPFFGATITPFCEPGCTTSIQPYSTPLREVTRQRVNAWIRDSGWFDGVVDFDAVTRDPADVAQLRKEFNSGDYLHPNVAGYQAMAAAFPVELFAQWNGGVDGWV